MNSINSSLALSFKGKTRYILADGSKTKWSETSPGLDVTLLNYFDREFRDSRTEKTVNKEQKEGLRLIQMKYFNGSVKEFKYDGKDKFSYSAKLSQPDDGVIGEEWEFSYTKETNPLIKKSFNSFMEVFKSFFNN